jgi:putative two-component system response regulator
MAEEIAHGHHEWYNGKGYPRGWKGDEIPLPARIAALADVYDALTTKRVYKDAMPHSQAVGIIAELSGRQFDPAIVQAFLRREAEFERLAVELADESSSETAETDKQVESTEAAELIQPRA